VRLADVVLFHEARSAQHAVMFIINAS